MQPTASFPVFYCVILALFCDAATITQQDTIHSKNFTSYHHDVVFGLPNISQEEFRPGEISYFHRLRQSQSHLAHMRRLQGDQILQNDVQNLVRKLAAVRSLAEVSWLWPSATEGSDGQRELSRPVRRLLDVVRSKAHARGDVTSYCVNDTGRILWGLTQKAPWATHIVDASGKPGAGITDARLHWLGDYQLCRDVIVTPDPRLYSQGFKGQYVEVTLYMVGKGAGAKWGLCVPDTCDAWHIYSLVHESLNYFNITGIIPSNKVDIKTNRREYTTATDASIVILSIIGALMILGTIYDVTAIQRPQWQREKAEAEKKKYLEAKTNGYHDDQQIQTDQEKTPILPVKNKDKEIGKLSKALLAFSVYTNTSKFLSTRQTPGSLTAIHGIRFLSMSWVMLAHLFAFGSPYMLNATDAFQMTQRWTFDVISNGFPSVDTFFTLSGLLTGYLTLKELLKNKSPKINWGLFYFHRFWRLTPPYMLTLLLALGLSQFFGGGALWDDVTPQDRKSCEDNWWTNLLYVNNLVKSDYMCFGHSWYLANDMQFFVLTPIMLVPFFYHTGAGLVSCAGMMLVHLVTTGVLSDHYNLPASPMTQHSGDYMTKYYMKPWCRIGPYIVGLAVGALLAKKQIRLNKLRAAVGWAVFSATGLAVVYGLHEQISGDIHPGVGVNALYNTVSRSAWGLSVCWVIVASYLGYGGLVNSILSFKPFVPLGRLTYMSYLVHPPIIYVYYSNMDSLMYMKDYNIIALYLGILSLVNMTAFLLMLALESPMIGLEKAFLPQRKR